MKTNYDAMEKRNGNRQIKSVVEEKKKKKWLPKF